MYIMFASTMRIRQPNLALKPRETKNPKQWYQWSQDRRVHMLTKKKKNIKKKPNYCNTIRRLRPIPFTVVADSKNKVPILYYKTFCKLNFRRRSFPLSTS